MRLTPMELTLMAAIVEQGFERNPAYRAADMIADNVTWFTAGDMIEILAWPGQRVGALMKSLAAKEMIENTGQDWIATQAGIEYTFKEAFK